MAIAVTRLTEISSLNRGARISKGGRVNFVGFRWMSSSGTTKQKGNHFPWSVGDDALPDKAARPAPERTPGAGCSEPEFARSPAAGESSTAGGAKSDGTGGKDGKSQQTKDKAGALARALSEVMSAAGLPPPTKGCVRDRLWWRSTSAFKCFEGARTSGATVAKASSVHGDESGAVRGRPRQSEPL